MPSVNSTIFTVSKDQTSMEITDLGNSTVKVVLPDDATGNVTVSDGVNTYLRLTMVRQFSMLLI